MDEVDEVVVEWTGRHACALQSALRMSEEGFATKLGMSRRAVTNWHKTPDTVPQPEIQQALDTLYESAGRPQKVRFWRIMAPNRAPAAPAPLPVEPAPSNGHVLLPELTKFTPVEFNDPDEYLQSVRANIDQFVSLDNAFGGAEIVRLSARYFAGLHAHLGSATYPPKIMRDLHAAAGELAEVVGWLAYDAEQHDLARRMNHESLHYTRLAGDRSMELLTLQNMSMHAGAQGRKGEALHVVRSVLEGDYRLSPRLRALFLTRKARALATGGDESALALIPEIRSRYEEGVSDTDPAWAWWVDERELNWHEAMIRRDLGQRSDAVGKFEESAAGVPAAETRSQYVHRAHLFQSQVEAGAWTDASTTLEQLLSLSTEVASTRATVLLRRTLADLDRSEKVPTGFRDQQRRLASTLDNVSI